MAFKILAILSVSLLIACENPIKRAVRDAEYSGYEVFGIQKRDLLKRRIADTRDSESEAAETLKDSLAELRKLYAMPETDLSRQYKTVKSSFQRSDEKAKEVRTSREKMETVAKDLFEEWNKEIGEIQTPELKASSRLKLTTSKKKFEEMDRGLKIAEGKVDPVLVKLKDQMLYLKHNLNAESLTQLKTESGRIENEISALIRDMRTAIANSDEFVKSLH